MTGKQPKRKPRPGIDEYGRTALHYACVEGNLDAVILALGTGADVNLQDDNGYSPLHFSAQSGSAQITNLLLENGGNPNQTDRHGNGPLWTATMNARGNTEIVELLLRNGADPKHQNMHGRSPYDMAMTINHGLEKIFVANGEA